jgi:hypothetical protein
MGGGGFCEAERNYRELGAETCNFRRGGVVWNWDQLV